MYQTFLDNLNTLYRDDLVAIAAATVDKPSYYVFQHDISAVYEKIKEESAFKAKVIADATKDFDNFSLTETERNFYRQILKGAAEAVYAKLMYLNKDLGKLFNFEEGPTAPLWLTGTSYGTGDIVSDGTYNYSSVGASNQGNALTDTTHWTKLTTTGIPLHVATQVYALGDYFKDTDDVIYEVITAGLIPAPASSPTLCTPCDPYADILNKVTIVISNASNFDSNALSAMSDNIYQAYVASVLAKWYQVNNLMDDYAFQYALFEKLLDKIRGLSFRTITSLKRTSGVI